MSRLRLLALASLVLPLLSVAGPAAATQGASFGIAPATGGRPDTRGVFELQAGPGAALSDEVAIENSSAIPLSLDIYASDAESTSQGDFALAAAGAVPRDAGAWLHLAPRYAHVTVPARTATGPTVLIVPFRLTVPATASPGDHAAGIVASLASSAVSPTGQHLKLLQRVASRVFVRVGGALAPRLSVRSLKATYRGTLNPLGEGSADLSFRLVNTGNVKLGGRVDVAVSGLFGPASRVRLADLPVLLPGTSVPERVRVHGVFPTVREKATVTVHAAAATGDVDPATAVATASTGFWAVPWVLLAIVVMLLLILTWVVRRTRRRPLPQPPVPTLPDVATDRSWGSAANAPQDLEAR